MARELKSLRELNVELKRLLNKLSTTGIKFTKKEYEEMAKRIAEKYEPRAKKGRKDAKCFGSPASGRA